LTNPEVQISLQSEFNEILEDRNKLRHEILKYGDSLVHLPINISRLITKAKQQFDIKNTAKSDLHPYDVIRDLKRLCDSLKVINDRDDISKEVNSNALLLLKIALRFHL